jgi:hypothetical protein
LRGKIDTTHPLTIGMEGEADFFFDTSPVFTLGEGHRAIAWFDNGSPLRSGWAWGQEALSGGALAAEFAVGKGSVVLYGPEVAFRAQPHGTFKLLFNALVVKSD